MTALSAVVLRRGGVADAQAMYALDLLCFDERFRFDEAAMRRYAQEAGALVLVAQAEEMLAGFLIAKIVRRGGLASAYLNTLDVHPDWRRQGLARKLLVLLEESLSRSAVRSIRLHVFQENLAAVDFYESAGFERLAKAPHYYGAGLHAWVYGKKLAADAGREMS